MTKQTKIKSHEIQYVLHVKPNNDEEYKDALDLLKMKGFTISAITRSLIKDFAKKIKECNI